MNMKKSNSQISLLQSVYLIRALAVFRFCVKLERFCLNTIIFFLATMPVRPTAHALSHLCMNTRFKPFNTSLSKGVRL